MAKGNQAAYRAAKRAALQNHDLKGVVTLDYPVEVRLLLLLLLLLLCQKLLHILKVRLLKLKVRAFKKIIRSGSTMRDSFFCLGTSNGSWLTPYMPPLI